MRTTGAWAAPIRRQEPLDREKGSIVQRHPHGQNSSAGLRKGESCNGAEPGRGRLARGVRFHVASLLPD